MFIKRFLLSIVALLCFIAANSINFEGKVVVDGVNYSFYYNDAGTYATEIGSAFVISGDYQGTLTIPESINVSLYEKTYSIAVSGFRLGALSGCNNLTSIILSKSITSIPSGLFSDCDNLTSIFIDDNNSKYDSRDNCVAVINKENNELVAGCKNSTIPNSVTSIGNGAFKNCSGLTSISIPNSVMSIGSEAFRECDELKSVIIGDGVTTINNYAFYNCASLENITIGSCVSQIGSFVFAECSKLTDVTSLNISVPPINYEAFYHSNDYSATLHVPFQALGAYKSTDPWSRFSKIVPVEGTEQKLTLTYMVDGEVYKTCELEYDIEIIPEPSPQKKGMTFSGWSEIPNRMPYYDVTVAGTFSWTKLTKDNVIYEVTDTLNNYCKVIQNSSASGEIKINSIEIEDTYYQPTKIVDKAFYGCKDIIKIEIPATVTTIGERAFANIDKLTDVTILAAEIPTTDRTAFENSYIEDYVTLHVPERAVEKYKATAPWKNFKEVVGIAGPKKCATPIISYEDGKIKFACETEGVTFKYQVTNADIGQAEGAEIEVEGVYTVSVYATKEDYVDSDTATKQISIIPKKGDLNNDGEVNVADHVVLSSIIMEQNKQNVKETEGEQEEVNQE